MSYVLSPPTGAAADHKNITSAGWFDLKQGPMAPILLGIVATTIAWGPTGASAAPRTTRIADVGWTSGAQTQTPRTPSQLGGAVRRLKDGSGLSWQQLAEVFGVSRRALHFWAHGGNMTAANVRRLETLTADLDALGQGETRSIRATLLAPRSGQPSIYDVWRSAVKPERVIVRPSVSELLDTVESNVRHRGRVVGVEDAQISLKSP